MIRYIITEHDCGQRLDRYLAKQMPLAPKSFFYKMLRKKNITLNKHKSDGSDKLICGDSIELFLSDDTIVKFGGNAYSKGNKDKTDAKEYHKLNKKSVDLMAMQKKSSEIKLDIIYEDKNIIIINKPAGLLSQKADAKDVSLVELIVDYALSTGKLTEEQLVTCKPSVCNRLDRNTSGIVCAGLSVRGLQFLSELFRTRDIHKYYYAIVKGRLESKCRTCGWLYKEENSNRVTVYKTHDEVPLSIQNDARYIETEYEPVKASDDATLIKVLLITGRSHQIRAHLSFLGHPIIGDSKYGSASINSYYKKHAGIRSQLLHAGEIVFPRLAEAAESLEPFKIEFSYLDGKDFKAALPDCFIRAMQLAGIKTMYTDAPAVAQDFYSKRGKHADMEFQRT